MARWVVKVHYGRQSNETGDGREYNLFFFQFILFMRNWCNENLILVEMLKKNYYDT